MPTREEAKEAAVAAPESKVEAPESDAQSETPKEAKPKREKAAPKEPTVCKCEVPDHDKVGAVATGDAVKFPGCRGGKSTRLFAPGHDAKLVGYVTRRYASGTLTAERAVEEVRVKSNASALLVGKVKAAVARIDSEKAAAARREQAAKDEKAKAPESTEATPEAKVDAVAATA